MRHIDLAPHLQHRGRLVDPLGHIADGQGVRGYIFALLPIAPRCGDCQPPGFVAQRKGKTIDLGLGDIGELGVGDEAEKPAHPGVELADLLVGEHVPEAEHPGLMPDLGEAGSRRRPDRGGRPIGDDKRWKPRLDRRIPLAQPIILGVRYSWRIFLMIGDVMRGDLFRQPRKLRLRGRFIQVVDRGVRFAHPAAF